MSDLPNVMPNNSLKFLKACNGNKWALLKSGILTLAGTTFLVASVSIWIEPIAAGDVAMLLIKIALTFVLLGLGFVAINLLDNNENIPTIRLDPMRRCLSVTELRKQGAPKHTTHYLLDELSEITMYDNLLTARDMKGRQVVAVPVYDPAAQKAIREALSI